MADLVFVSILVAFFALCVVYLRWCDRIIGPDESGVDRDVADSSYVVTDATSAGASATGVPTT